MNVGKNVGKFFVFVCGVLFLLCTGGCSMSPMPFTVINNTTQFVDVGCEELVVEKNMAPGESRTIDVATLYHGCDFTLVAKGHTAAGEPLGVATHEMIFVHSYSDGYYGGGYGGGSYGYRNYNRSRSSSAPWLIESFRPPQDVKNSVRRSR